MELFEGLLQKDKDEFRRVCNKLMSICFICKQNEDTKSDFYFILLYCFCYYVANGRTLFVVQSHYEVLPRLVEMLGILPGIAYHCLLALNIVPYPYLFESIR